MTNSKYANGRISLLPREYATFRPKIFGFLLKEVLPHSKSILDPMAGTAPLIPYVEKTGIEGHFNDILPLYNFINKAKTLTCFFSLRRKENRNMNFLTREAIRCLRPLDQKRLLVSTTWIHEDIVGNLIDAWEKAKEYENEISTILKAIILLCVGPYSCFTPSISNHTWLKMGGMSTGKSLKDIVQESVNKLQSFYSYHYSNTKIANLGLCKFSCQDAKLLNLETKYDTIFTSPPYANRFDPRIFYGPELFFLKHVGHVVKDEAILGTTKVRDYSNYEDDMLFIKRVAPETLSFLEPVIEKSEKREANYYPRWFVRYYSDLFKSLQNFLKFLESKGNIYIVLQNNIHRGELNEMPKYLLDFFKRAGLDASVVYKKVQPHLGKRNISAKYPIVIKKHLECILKAHR